MSEYGHCKSCGKFDWLKYHSCPPLWEVAPIEGGEPNWEASGHFHAGYPGDAAEAAAKELDDYCEPRERTLAVRKLGESEWKAFDVNFEHEVVYYAEEVDKDDLE